MKRLEQTAKAKDLIKWSKQNDKKYFWFLCKENIC